MTNNKEIEHQIQVLATNLEILNQRLNQDPDALISPGEKAIKDSIKEFETRLEYINNLLKTLQNDNSFNTEKNALSSEISRLNTVISNLKKFDKDWIQYVLAEIKRFNTISQSLDKNLKDYYTKTYLLLDAQKINITKSVYSQLYKSLKRDNLIMMGITTFLSSVVALLVILGLVYFIT